jgi:hypothetical protein
MPGIGEREHQLQKAINRWENEGGAIATNERPRPRITDDRKAAQKGAEGNALAEQGQSLEGLPFDRL